MERDLKKRGKGKSEESEETKKISASDLDRKALRPQILVLVLLLVRKQMPYGKPGETILNLWLQVTLVKFFLNSSQTCTCLGTYFLSTLERSTTRSTPLN